MTPKKASKKVTALVGCYELLESTILDYDDIAKKLQRKKPAIAHVLGMLLEMREACQGQRATIEVALK